MIKYLIWLYDIKYLIWLYGIKHLIQTILNIIFELMLYTLMYKNINSLFISESHGEMAEWEREKCYENIRLR